MFSRGNRVGIAVWMAMTLLSACAVGEIGSAPGEARFAGDPTATPTPGPQPDDPGPRPGDDDDAPAPTEPTAPEDPSAPSEPGDPSTPPPSTPPPSTPPPTTPPPTTPPPSASCPGVAPDVGTTTGWRNNEAPTAAYDTLDFELWARPGADDLNGIIAIGGEDVDTFSDAAILVRFASDGLVDARDGPGYDADRTFTYDANAWYHIIVSADVQSETYNVEVAPCGGNMTELITDAAFRADVAVSDKLDHWALYSATSAGIEVSTPTWVASGSCIPSTCGSLGMECGSPSNGCGGVLSCGGCASGETCTNGSCVAPPAPPPPAPPPSPPPGGGSDDGYPSAATTGINDYWCPRWNQLKRTGMPNDIRSAGSSWEYYEKNGEVDVEANDVTIRCFYIAKGGGTGDYGLITCEDGCNEGFLLEDTHTDLTDRSGDYGVAMRMGSDEMSVRRFYTHLGCDGIKLGGGLFQDSYIQDTKGRTGVGNAVWPDGWVGTQGDAIGRSERDYCNRADPHSDAIQDAGSQRGPVWVIGNRIESPWQAPNAGMQISDGYQHDMTVIGNWFQGGGVASAFNVDKGGWGDMVFYDNVVMRDSWCQAGFHTSWEGNAAVFDGGEIGQGTGCVEALRNGSYANNYTDVDAGGNADGAVWDNGGKGGFPGKCGNPSSGGRGCVSNENACGRENGWPASARAGGNWTHVTPVPTWYVTNLSLPERTSCKAGSASCNDIDVRANATGVTPRGYSAGGYQERWRYSCGGSSTNLMNDGSQSQTPCGRGHCLGGYQDDRADLWYDYPACNGLSSCTFTDVCDFSSESAGTYTVKVYSESGPGSGVRASDHDEIVFTVTP